MMSKEEVMYMSGCDPVWESKNGPLDEWFDKIHLSFIFPFISFSEVISFRQIIFCTLIYRECPLVHLGFGASLNYSLKSEN
jgi:hypothetical protein